MDQGVIKDLKTYYTWYSMERIVKSVEENPARENIMDVWEDYTTEDAINVVEKAMKAIKLKAISPYWGKWCSDGIHDFTGFRTEPMKKS